MLGQTTGTRPSPRDGLIFRQGTAAGQLLPIPRVLRRVADELRLFCLAAEGVRLALVVQRRRDLLLQCLGQVGIKARPPRDSLYIWARCPEGYTSLQFATTLLEEAGVVVTPGIGYGKHGEGYIRLSLTVPDHRLEEAVARLSRWSASNRGQNILT